MHDFSCIKLEPNAQQGKHVECRDEFVKKVAWFLVSIQFPYEQ